MLSLLQAIILGIVQGITEWLPISSSGHLVIFQQLFGLQVPVFFDVLLHLGTLTVIFVFFWKDIIKLFKALVQRDSNSEYGKLLIFITIGSIPTALIGILFNEVLASFFSNLLVVGIGLIATGTLLFFCERRESNKELKLRDSLWIGLVQGLAIIPGISRSGATIGTGLLRGLNREKVTRFSFLLSIPAIIGAAIFESGNVTWSTVEWFPVIVGIVVSGLVGYFSLKLLLRFVKERRLRWFSWYCWGLGVLLLTLFI
jgi:undecaprenyl-diphosphatase